MICQNFFICILQNFKECLTRRGPNSFNEVADEFKGKINLYFCSSVLHLRGSDLVAQPVTDERKNIFMWNGEIFTNELVLLCYFFLIIVFDVFPR